MDEVAELLKTWELPDLIPKFAEQAINIQALSALTPNDVKDIIPQTGPRVLFMRCWKAWKAEFLCINSSLPNLDLSDLEFGRDPVINISLAEEKENVPTSNVENFIIVNENVPPNSGEIEQGTQSGLLERILLKSLEPWSLVEIKWKNTFKYRITLLHTNHNDQTLDSYMNEYPALRKPLGYTLEEDKNLAAFLAIPHLLNTTPINRKRKQKKPSCSWKPSKVETRDAFIKHLRSDAEINLRLGNPSETGIKEKCVWFGIKDFDLFNQIGVDCMHDILEGVAKTGPVSRVTLGKSSNEQFIRSSLVICQRKSLVQVTWATVSTTRYAKGTILVYDTSPDDLLPVFFKVQNVFCMILIV
ncbi:hypothetical protein HF086_007168 [Spodoptera exigua]|uniref:Uncharacterized protein n=1 Tax=Spodoptera exigua TaxID=7107 RepID=A0A922MGQ1_SPOEX|nr:hypothetical protein HF086_007168 [Spodoptera exigua]